MAWMHPGWDPVLWRVGPVSVYWYGMLYVISFLLVHGMMGRDVRIGRVTGWSQEACSDLLGACMLGVLVGGRLGYVVFYNTNLLWTAPWEVLWIWQGGMSFHGGLLGVWGAVVGYARRHKRSVCAITDWLVLWVPIGLALGRLGNFINGELWGRITDVPWAVINPALDGLPRHPSQLYEMVGEGWVLWWVVRCVPARWVQPVGVRTSVFALGYGMIRCMLECFREPDPQYGFLAWGWLTMGQVLSLLLCGVGVVLWWRAVRRPALPLGSRLP